MFYLILIPPRKISIFYLSLERSGDRKINIFILFLLNNLTYN